MLSQFPSNLSYLQNNLPENNVEPVPAKSEPVQLCGCVVFFVVVPAKSELPQKKSTGTYCGTVPAKSELPPKQSAGK